MAPLLQLLRCALACGCCALAPGLQAQIALPAKPPIHRVGLAYRMAFNLQADFTNRGQSDPLPPGAPSGTAPVTYTDGYVRTDSSGNTDGLTWNWGYLHPDQIRGDSLSFVSSSPGTLDPEVRDEVVPGVELTYGLRLGGSSRMSWGLEAAANFASAALSSQGQIATELVALDTYSLGGIVPPAAPYFGTFGGPGPLISDSFSRSPLAFDGELDSALYGFRLGPLVDLPLGNRAALQLSAGLAVVVADSEFSWTQTSPNTDLAASMPGAGSSTETEWLPGGYASASLSWSLSARAALSLGLQYQNTGKTTVDAGDKRAELDLSRAFFLSVGLSLQPF